MTYPSNLQAKPRREPRVKPVKEGGLGSSAARGVRREGWREDRPPLASELANQF